MSDDEKRRFLRERGLFLADGSFDFHEAIVAANETCEVAWPTTPGGAAPISLPVDARTGRPPSRRWRGSSL